MLSEAPLQGGSWTAASVGSAVLAACEAIKEKVFKLAQKLKNSPFTDADLQQVSFDGGRITHKLDASKAIEIVTVMKQSGEVSIEEEATNIPNLLHMLEYSFNTHSAVFVEVKVDEDLGTVNRFARGKRDCRRKSPQPQNSPQPDFRGSGLGHWYGFGRRVGD